MAELSIEQGWRDRSLLTGVRLPDGTSSGGFLIDRDEGLLLLLFAGEEDLRIGVGDRVAVARERELTVDGVRRGTFTGERVTALDVRA